MQQSSLQSTPSHLHKTQVLRHRNTLKVLNRKRRHLARPPIATAHIPQDQLPPRRERIQASPAYAPDLATILLCVSKNLPPDTTALVSFMHSKHEKPSEGVVSAAPGDADADDQDVVGVCCEEECAVGGGDLAEDVVDVNAEA